MSRADARPRRWPDLLIGLLVLLLLAGFTLLLLEQRPEQVTQAPTPPVTAAESAPVIPSAPGTDLELPEVPTIPETPDPTPPASAAAEESAAAGTTAAAAPPQTASREEPPAAAAPAQPAPASPDSVTSPQPQDTAAPPTPAPRSERAEVPVVPAAPIPAAPPAPPPPAVTLPTPPENPAALGSSTPAPAREEPAAAAPRAGGAVPTSEQRTPLRSDYRISLGTFGSEAAAQNSASAVEALGYTVYFIDLGNQVVAQVGPFADEATGRQALADIQRASPQAVLYPPRGRSLSQAEETGTERERTEPPPSEATSSAEPPAAAPSDPVYLQVGAFDRVESAQRMVALLRDQGYAPTVNAPEGKKVTVLIGPFSGEALIRAEENLDANGFDHFRVQ